MYPAICLCHKSQTGDHGNKESDPVPPIVPDLDLSRFFSASPVHDFQQREPQSS